MPGTGQPANGIVIEIDLFFEPHILKNKMCPLHSISACRLLFGIWVNSVLSEHHNDCGAGT